MEANRLLAIAKGDEKADILFRNCQMLDVFSGSFTRGDVAVADGIIVGFGGKGVEVVDLDGLFLVPGFIDAHVHIESSQVSPVEFAKACLPHGTTTVIADPHEIANVLGLSGIRYMLEVSEGLPLRIMFMAPSCVPATHLETAGAELSSELVAEILSWPRVIGLGEVMNFQGVLACDHEVWGKLKAAHGRSIDGHAPGLVGPALWAYTLAGPSTDHESTTLAEAREKLQAGMHILIREGTTARNLATLVPLLSQQTAPFVHFCTDDRHPETILAEGHIDACIRKAVASGVPPEVAITAATVHAARGFRLWDVGAIAPGFRADLLVISDLERVKVEQVYVDGKLVAEGGRCVVEFPSLSAENVRSTVRVDLEKLSFRIPPGKGKARAIRVIPGQVVTEKVLVEAKIAGGEVVADPKRDLLKIAVVERHRGTGNVGLGLVQGFGLKAGALASSVAHDSHNIIVVGVSDEDMHAAVAALVDLGGGQVVVSNGKIVALPLPIAGLMSDRSISEVTKMAQELNRAARALGCQLPDPFMTLSFLALPVIPALKLTDLGLVDVEQFRIVSLFVENDTS